MNTTEIKALLEKYFAAETSLAEENELRELFASGNYSPEFEAEAAVFGYINREAGEKKKDPEFVQELERIMKSLPEPSRRRNLKRVSWMAAASIILLFGLFFTYRHNYVSSEEKAAILYKQVEIKKVYIAMNIISSNLQGCMSHANYMKKFTRPTNSIDRNYE
jgi:hypothetical protein